MKKLLINKKVNMDILDILARESEASSQVYLYEEDGHWYAYEHSALLMNKLSKGCVIIKQTIIDLYELILKKAEIDLSLLDNCSITSCSDTELILSMPTQ